MTTNLTTCPYCFQQKYYTSATPSPGNAWENDLDGKIKRTEDLISRLFVERSRLCRKRNEMRSTIYSLPPENLALIFNFACPPLDFLQKYGIDSEPHNLFASSLSRLSLGTANKVTYPRIIGVLSAVSAHWRNVVSSTPSLWTSFIADDKNLCLMRAVFARSSNLPISASLICPDSLTSYKSSIISPILQEHAPRIRRLHLSNTSSAWIKQHLPSYTDLQLLSLQSDWIPETIPFSVESSCSHLILKNFECRVSLSWLKIEILHLSQMPLAVCLEMLEKCTQLIEYRLRSPSTCPIEEIELPSSPFILPRLKVFEWQVNDKDTMDRAMLQYARMPALQTLSWTESNSRPKSSSIASAFFEHLPSTVSEIEIGYAMTHEGFSVFSYFLSLPNVEGLVLRKCAGTFMDDVFSSLGFKPCLVENPDMLPLPKLKSIYVDSFTGHLDQDKVLGSLRRYCSQQTGSLQESPLRLEFIKRQVEWTPEFKEELVRMVEQGYRVELWENSKPVDWLPRSSFTARLSLISL